MLVWLVGIFGCAMRKRLQDLRSPTMELFFKKKETEVGRFLVPQALCRDDKELGKLILKPGQGFLFELQGKLHTPNPESSQGRMNLLLRDRSDSSEMERTPESSPS